jgi:hypothetical protein
VWNPRTSTIRAEAVARLLLELVSKAGRLARMRGSYLRHCLGRRAPGRRPGPESAPGLEPCGGRVDGIVSRSLYMNGALETAVTGRPNWGSGTILVIGQCAGAGDGHYFPGDLDEVTMYPSGLSAARIKAHCLGGSRGAPRAEVRAHRLAVGTSRLPRCSPAPCESIPHVGPNGCSNFSAFLSNV